MELGPATLTVGRRRVRTRNTAPANCIRAAHNRDTGQGGGEPTSPSSDWRL